MSGQVEPVNAEIIKDQALNLFEFRSDDPVVIPMRAEMSAHQPPDQSGLYRLSNEAEMRRPASILIDGQPDSASVGQFSQPLAGVQIGDEGLLTQNVFAGSKRLFDDLDSIFGMRRDVNDFDRIAPQQLAVIGRDRRVGIKSLLIGASFAFGVVAK